MDQVETARAETALEPGSLEPARPGTRPHHTTRPGATRADDDPAARSLVRAIAGHPVIRHLAILSGFIAAGILATWPRAMYLDGRLPLKSDEGSDVWDLWWMAHQVTRLYYPWVTRAMAAPVGTELGFHTLMPLPGLLMIPVTLAFGAVFSFNLLSTLLPGLLCYAMYRAARLWIPSQVGAVAAALFFGLSANLTWRAWYHMNIALGTLFLPLALEAATRLRRAPGRRQVVLLGLVVGASALVDQIGTVLVVILAVAVLLPWLVRHPSARKLAAAGGAVIVGVAIASPQIFAMVQQARAGQAPQGSPTSSYIHYAVGLPQLFGPSPRVAAFGLKSLGASYYHGHTAEAIPTFGFVLTALAIAGLLATWRRRSSRLFALGWFSCAALALGPVLWIGATKYAPFAEVSNGYQLSRIMPYTWLVQVPGLNNFREAARFTLLGMVPAAMLAGMAVHWLRLHIAPLLIGVLALAVLEGGWTGDLSITPTALRSPPTRAVLPALDRPIAADRSKSIVVDVPFALWGGTGLYGKWLRPEALALATVDEHPRGEAFLARVPKSVSTAIKKHKFYACLVNTQAGRPCLPRTVRRARADARRMHIGWVLVWHWTPDIGHYLAGTGFRFDYRADGVAVYRPAAAIPTS